MRRRRRRWLRWLVGVSLGLLGLVLVAVGLVVIVTSTAAGTGWALRRAVAWYDGKIPGHVSIEGTRGALVSGVCIDGLRLADARDQPLVTARTLCLDPRVAPLLSGTVELEELVLADGTLHLWPEAAWGDLAPPSPEPPPDEPPGPDLPVRIVGPLVIVGFDVKAHGEGEPAELVRDAWLHAELVAEGREASVDVRSLWGQVPAAGTAVLAGHADVRWSSPALEVRQLGLVTSYGIVEALDARLDADAMRYWARLRATAFVPPSGATPEVLAPVTLAIEGTDATAVVFATAHAAELGRAELSAVAALVAEPGVTAFLHVEPAEPLGLPPVSAWLTARASTPASQQARLLAHAPGVMVAAAWDGREARAQAYVDGAEVDASAIIEDGQLRRAQGTVTVASAARATAALDALVPVEVPRIEGAGRAAARCRFEPSLRCAIEAAVARQGDRLETAAVVEMDEVDEAIRIRLRRLAGQLRGEPVRLAAPAVVTIADDAVAITPLRLAIAGGTIEAEGRVASTGPSDLEVRLARIDLGVVPRFVPSVPIGGRLGGTLGARGEPSRPRLSAAIDVRGLAWDREPLGHVRLRAAYEDRRARADVRWQYGATRVRASADVPLALDLEGPSIEGPTVSTPVRADVDVRRLALADVAQWVDGPALDGFVDATVRASGRLGRPVVDVELTGTQLRLDDRVIGQVHVLATARDADVAATVDLRGPTLGRTHVEATIPVALRPLQGGVQYRARADHHVSATLERLNLAGLRPWLDPAFDGATPEIAGLVRGQLEATASAGAVRGRVELLARDLVAAGYDVGVTRAIVELADEETRAQVEVSGPWARYVGLEASAPLVLAWPPSAPQWSPRTPLAARVELVDVEIGGIGRFGPGPAFGGELEGTLVLGGTAGRPTLAVELTIDDLTHGDHALGDVRLRTDYDGEMVVATLEQRAGAAQVVARGRVPLSVDLATPAVAWHDDRPHRLSVRVQGLSHETVGALVELPAELRFQAAARLEASGTAADPHAVMRLRGHVDPDAPGALPIPVAVHLDVEPSRQDARVMLGAHGPEGLVVEAHAAAPLATLLAGRGDPSAVEIDVVARARDFSLRELAPLLPQSLHDPRGRLALEASVRGPIAGPTMKGWVALHEGALTVVPLRQRFEDVELRARMDGPNLALEHLRARSADGTAAAEARLHLAPGATRGSATLTTRKLPVVRPGLPAMQLDLRVKAELDATGDVTAVSLRASDGFLDLLAMSPLASAKPIPADDGVVYVDVEGLAQASRSEAAAKEPWLPEDVQFSLVLEDPLRVRGPSADMDWTGSFELLRRAETPPQAKGMFQTRGGRVSLLGHDFAIETATIRFPEEGELDPFVDLVATTDTNEALVTMLVRGRASRPRLELRSEPPMPESDVFALLITGHADASQADDREFSAKAASVLAAVQNPALQQHMRDTIGIDRVGVGFGETVEQPIVTVGKRVNEKLYMEAGYHHNAPRGTNEAEIRLEYRFAPPRWSVETFFGDAAQGGVGLWWQRRFASRGQRRAERERAAQPRAAGSTTPHAIRSPEAPAGSER
jgi:autotransporter translocation and assembly factor TamB